MGFFERGGPPKETLEKMHGDSETTLNAEAAQSREKTILERFRGDSKKIAQVLMFLTAASLGTGMSREAHAQDAPSSPDTEHVQHDAQSIEVDMSKVTESGRWAGDMADSAQADVSTIHDAASAEAFARKYAGGLVREYFHPTKGEISEGSYGIKQREYSPDDIQNIMKSTLEIQRMLTTLNEQYGVASYEVQMKRLDTMIQRLDRQASPAYRMQREALQQALGR